MDRNIIAIPTRLRLQTQIQATRLWAEDDAMKAAWQWAKKWCKTEELETVKVSRPPTTVITANGSIDTTEEVTVYVKDVEMFVTVQLLEDTPAVLSRRNTAKKLGAHKSGKKAKIQEISRMAKLYLPSALNSSLSSFSVDQVKHTLRFQQKIHLQAPTS